MGSIKDLMFDDFEDESIVPDDNDTIQEAYPKKLFVDGYDVNHYHDGDIPVYEILDNNGNIIDVAHSTNEMHEITGNIDRDDEDE